MQETQKKCTLCDKDSEVVQKELPGYKKPETFTIYECENCETMFTFPGETGESIYEDIYKVAKKLAGYERYEYFAKNIKKEKKPLDFLAKQGQMYWGVREYLKESKVKSILEVGSGLGYQVYALKKQGFDAQGIDVSTEAVNKASDTFGKMYSCSSLEEIAKSGKRFDMVIMTEVIEHVEKPIELIKKIKEVLKENGKIFITTPNRSYFNKSEIWKTELPPVHLWWFSEKSIKHIAEKNNLEISFLDFTKHNKKYPTLVKTLAKSEASLNKDGEPIQKENIITKTLRKVKILHKGYRFISRIAGIIGYQRYNKNNLKKSLTIAAILEQKNNEHSKQHN